MMPMTSAPFFRPLSSPSAGRRTLRTMSASSDRVLGVLGDGRAGCLELGVGDAGLGFRRRPARRRPRRGSCTSSPCRAWSPRGSRQDLSRRERRSACYLPVVRAESSRSEDQSAAPYIMYCPPLMERVDPVMKPPSSPARNATARAISSGLPKPPDRDQRNDLRLQHLRVDRLDHLGADVARTDRVHRDALVGVLLRQRLDEADVARLGGRVVHLPHLAFLAVDRRDHDHPPPARAPACPRSPAGSC